MICLNCGAVFNQQDVEKHICKVIIPAGKQINSVTGILESVE